MKIIKRIFSLIAIILIALVLIGQSNMGHSAFKSGTHRGTLIELDGNTIRYDQKGSGKDILLIHGTPGSIEDWDGIFDSLAVDYRVTAFDRLGHGYSSNNNYDYCLKDNAEMVKKLIPKLRLTSPMIIGHSYGGSTVAELLTQHYDDRLKYMIIDSPLFFAKPDFSFKAVATPLIGKGLAVLANYSIAEKQIEEGIAAALKNQTNSQLRHLIDERKNIWLQPKVIYSKSKESVNYQNNLANISDEYKNITADVTVVTGDNEEYTRAADCKKFCDLVTTDSLVIYSNTGHYIQMDQSAQLIKLIREKMQQ